MHLYMFICMYECMFVLTECDLSLVFVQRRSSFNPVLVTGTASKPVVNKAKQIVAIVDRIETRYTAIILTVSLKIFSLLLEDEFACNTPLRVCP